MPVDKYRSVEQMPRPPRLTGEPLVASIRRVWRRAFLLSPADCPRGVTRFRSLEEANRAREERVRARMERRRAGSAEG